MSQRRALAILMNPVPHERVTTSERNVRICAGLLGCEDVEIVNLHAWPTRDLPALAAVAHQAQGWLEARAAIERALSSADVLIAGWGVGRFSRDARSHLDNQLRWLATAAEGAGHSSAFQVGDPPRHPSRWRQFTSPVHERFEGATFEERLRNSLQERALARFQGERSASALATTATGRFSAGAGKHPDA
jgi:hypothetical protein